jgi:Icc-related predicted phosphoesterase
LPEIADDLSSADLVLLTGDFTHFGHRAAAGQVVNAVRAFNPNILAVPGNCDHAEAAEFLTDEGLNLDGTYREIDKICFLGLGGSLPCPGTTPYEMTDNEFETRLCHATEGLDRQKPLILVMHQPPEGTTADRLRQGIHVGSVSLRAFIEERKPLICFCGHIHEGRGIDTIGPTKIVNPGPLGYGCHAFAIVSDRVEELEIRGLEK